MIHLSSFARSISRNLSQRRAYLLVLLTVIALLFAQPLLVRAKPTTRAQVQLAEIAQSTKSPTEEPEEEASQDDSEDETATTTATATVEAPAADQPNIASQEATTDTISVEVPAQNQQIDGALALPQEWQGDATISASELAQVAPPLEAEVIQGDFQITYVSAETGDSLRILPVPTDGELGTLRIGLTLDQTSSLLPFPAGETLLLQASARVYAPDATTRLVIAEESGSSSVALDGVNWNEYQVARAIAEDATTVEIVLEWNNVPANGWLELRGFSVAPVPSSEAIALSPTDTPQIYEAVAISPTAPPPPTPAPAIDAPTPLPTATPLPDTVSGAAGSSAPISDTAILTPTATFIVVTSTPLPTDVLEQATRVAQATDWARILGPATPTPPNMMTATPTVTPLVLVNTPTPANEATAAQMAVLATAIAFTTGTPTPIPPNATVLIATATNVPPTATPRATNTATPIFVLLDDIPIAEPTVTPVVPEVLYNKIVFLSSYRGNPSAPNAMMMNPDGTGVGLLTTNYFYNIAALQDTYSADARFHVYSLREAGGEAHNAGLIQLFWDDALYNSPQHQLTYFGAGVAWAPAWSPRSETIAYVSSETGNDEIWVSNTNQWPATQLTHNAWEWDHHPSYSPDGSQIVFSSNRVTGRRQLWIMSSSGENQAQLTNFTFEAWNPVWIKYVAPDGEAE